MKSHKHSSSFSAAVALCATLCLCLLGCGGKKNPDGMPPLVPCEITIQQEGQPLVGANVSILPMAGDEKWSAVGRTDEKGTAVLHTWGQYAGAAEGKYKVTVSKTEVESVVPPDATSEERAKLPPDKTFVCVEAIYSDAAKTPLEIELNKGTKSFTLDAGKKVRTLDTRY